MGDRALVVIKDAGEVSPVCYLHWSGSDVPAFLAKHKELMASRGADVEYAAARFVGIAHENNAGNTSLGLWNAPADLQKAIQADDAAFLNNYSYGDAGVIVVDVTDYSWKAYGGYLSEWVDGKEPDTNAA